MAMAFFQKIGQFDMKENYVSIIKNEQKVDCPIMDTVHFCILVIEARTMLVTAKPVHQLPGCTLR